MAVPKHKTSKSKRDKRRTHKKIGAPEVGTCPECGEAQASPSCLPGMR
jgi:large subunit ribosomal protein L32